MTPRPPQRANGEQLFPSLVSTSDTSERMEEKRESNKDTCLIQELKEAEEVMKRYGGRLGPL